jgi:hypothetical protein
LNYDDVDAVSDRPVSFEEYERAVLRYRECMAANGTPLGDFRYDGPTRLYDWTVREGSFDSPGAQACDNEFTSIDRQWQSQVEHLQGPAREARRVKIIECMQGKGADVDPNLPYRELMMRAVPEFPECVESAFQD